MLFFHQRVARSGLDKSMESHKTFPLTSVFSPSRSLYTDPCECTKNTTLEDAFQFKQMFKVLPRIFILVEASIEKRCNKFGITYIPPKVFDTVDATLERKANLNKAIAAGNKRRQRANLTPEQKESQKVADMMQKRAALANETMAETEKRRNKNRMSHLTCRKRRDSKKYISLAKERKADDMMRKRAERANESLENKNARKERDKHAKKRAQEKESPEKKAARTKRLRIVMERARWKESPEKRKTQKEKNRIAMIRKRKNETKEERKKRQNQNLKSQHKHRTGVDLEINAALVKKSMEATKEKLEYKEISSCLLEAVGIKDVMRQACIYVSLPHSECQIGRRMCEKNVDNTDIKDLEAVGIKSKRKQACVYDHPSHSVCRIGQRMYEKTVEDMGIKDWTTGAYRYYSPGWGRGCGPDAKIAICDIDDFRSNYEVDPHILKKLNFSCEEIRAIVEDVVPTERIFDRFKKDIGPMHPIPIVNYLVCHKVGMTDGCETLVMRTEDERDADGFLSNVTTGIRTFTSKEYQSTDPPTGVKVYQDQIREIVNGHIKLFKGERSYQVLCKCYYHDCKYCLDERE